ncbi:MAG TPA: putative aminohydrolase SsnA [Ornithinibacter sp.]|nr:putative aminohydrolase SsnA [Ornithinibacter sp.]
MIVTGTHVITGDPGRPVVGNGAVLVHEGLVAAVGPASDLRGAHPVETVVDTGRVVMPGLVNAHTHAYSAYARGMAVHAPTRDFDEILGNLWWALDRLLEPEDVRLNATTTFTESVRCGVTTVFDHHSSPNAIPGSLTTIADAAGRVGLRACLAYETSDRDGPRAFAEAVAENVDFMRAVNVDGQCRVRGLFGMHASFTLSQTSLDTIGAEAASVPGGYHVHVAEGPQDQPRTVASSGHRVVDRLAARGMVGPDSLAAHCVHVTPAEIEVLAERGALVVHNPHSNLSNAVGFAPVVEMLGRGIRVGLGTDAYTADVLASMQVAKIAASGHRLDPTVGFGEAVAMCFEHNPAIASTVFGCDIGVLRPGAVADLVTLDYRPPTALDTRSVWEHVVFGMCGAQVTDVMVGGEWVLREREFTRLDEAEVLAHSAERAERVWKEL